MKQNVIFEWFIKTFISIHMIRSLAESGIRVIVSTGTIKIIVWAKTWYTTKMFNISCLYSNGISTTRMFFFSLCMWMKKPLLKANLISNEEKKKRDKKKTELTYLIFDSYELTKIHQIFYMTLTMWSLRPDISLFWRCLVSSATRSAYQHIHQILNL